MDPAVSRPRRRRPPGHRRAPASRSSREGGTAADAAVAAGLASCVAETVMTGLLGGGHAIYFDAAVGAGAEPRLLLRRAGSRRGAARRRARRARGAVRRGARPLRGRARVVRRPRRSRGARRAAGARTGGCPGRGSSSRRCGSRATGVTMPPAHAACLAMLAPVMTLREGARIYAPGGRLLQARRPARAAGARRGARVARRRGRRQRLHGHDRRGAARALGRARRPA